LAKNGLFLRKYHQRINNFSRYETIKLKKVFWLIKIFGEKLRIRLEDRFLSVDYPENVLISKPQMTSIPTKEEIEIVVNFLISPDACAESLTASLASILDQSDPHWKCWIINPKEEVISILEQFKDERIKTYSVGGIIDYLSPLLIDQIKGRYFCWINPGDTVHSSFVEYLARIHGDIIFFDQAIKINSHNKLRYFLKPQWSPELWLNVDILYGAAFRVEFIKNIIAQREDKWLARAILVAQDVLHIPQPLLTSHTYPWSIDKEVEKHSQLVMEYISLQEILPPSLSLRKNGSLKFNWQRSTRKVSIIIPNRDNPLLLKRCLNSIYEKTEHPYFEIVIVDDHSTNQQVLNLYRDFSENKQNFRIIKGESPFNFSRACNFGAIKADGDLLLFLNNDTEIISPDWLTNMVGVASLPGVGAVGAKLLYPNGKVQHAGVVIGLEGHASHIFQGISDDPYTFYGHVDWMRNVSAVTAACMLVPKEVFWQVGGFDERFQIAFGDIDFCLRLRDAGYRIVYTPDATLIHHEGKSRGKYIPHHDFQVKTDYFFSKVAADDPYFHPALSRAWRIPTLRRKWEQDPLERLQKISEYFGAK